MKRLFFLLLILTVGIPAFSNGVLRGTITSDEGPLAFVNVGLKGYNIGTYTDEDGHFHLKEIPEGNYHVQISSVGFHTVEKEVAINEGDEIKLEVVLDRSFSQLDEIVISGARTEQRKGDAAVVVGVIDKKALEAVQANTLADGLNFQSGLRMETDCQTCGYSQLRMNGLGGAYSMILIDSRPVFSSLMGLYGLEMIPVNLIERIEVVKGGGSALYGSSAIAGTVNVITREPRKDYLSLGSERRCD